MASAPPSALDTTPLPPPPAPAAAAPPALDAAHAALHDSVRAHFADAAFALDGAPLADAERFWLSHECIARYLRATKWAAPTAITRLEATLRWRRERALADVAAHTTLVEPEAVTGKEILYGYDTARRPAFYMFPSRQNTDGAARQVEFAVWMLERAIDLMGPGVETVDLLINFADRAKNPALGTARQVLSILQDHYPERLGLALITNVPFYVTAFFTLITPFIDPATRPKMRFNPKVLDDGTFTPEMLMQVWGGARPFAYEHKEYWPALVNMCDARRAGWMERWKELGGTVGIREWDYKSEAEGVADVKQAIPAEAAKN